MPNNNSNGSRNPSANNKMLIDATHPEETRVVVQRNGRVEEFDFESAARKLLRGNIYLAKVTRVEPSLQAAFVDYGGNRHGFLAFNEIHPDYYQIPVADRRALIEAETAAEAEEEAAADRAAEAAERRSRRRGGRRPAGSHPDDVEVAAVDVSSLLPPEEPNQADDEPGSGERDREHAAEHDPSSDEYAQRAAPERTEPDAYVRSEPVVLDLPEPTAAHEASTTDEPRSERDDDAGSTGSDADVSREADLETTRGHDDRSYDDRVPAALDADDSNDDHVETVDTDEIIETVDNGNGVEAEDIETVTDSEDVLEEVPTRPRRRLRSYKIQEVTKRRQVLLVQVVKEERGTKGAALTTYLSLAGRYTVLMPNTARGGGISRKITNPQDRKRLKAIAAELDVPEGMGLIIRTAGAARTKQEIKRDYEYLLRLWESVRELALSSNAPALVYEEGNLIKRSIRDLYGKEVDEVIVAGRTAYEEARDFMRMLMPSHAKNVHHYEDPEPLFTRYGMERQLNAMFSPYVHLRSGGYLVINQTEALVAIDINSGKSTREFSIEETALSTNLEAADEIARQLKLRDLAGLVVIDFIDMEEKRNNRAVERRLKDALQHDRARIQLGRISHFGLLEMSRQRMRTGVLEGSTTQCPHCQGTGIIRSTESVALAVLRGLEDALMAGQPASLTATTIASVALYILNHKRSYIVEMEGRYGVTIQILASDKVQGANFTIDRQARSAEPQRRPDRNAVNMDWGFEDEEEADADAGEEAEPISRGEESASQEGDQEGGQEGGPEGGQGEGRRRRRRRRGRRGDREGGTGHRSAQDSGDDNVDRTMSGHPGDGPQPYIDEIGEAGAYADRGRGGGESGYVESGAEPHDGEDGDEAEEGQVRVSDGEGQTDEPRRRRRRGRRGGRRNQERDRQPVAEGQDKGDEHLPAPHGDGEVVIAEATQEGGRSPVEPREHVPATSIVSAVDSADGKHHPVAANGHSRASEEIEVKVDVEAEKGARVPEPVPEPLSEVIAAEPAAAVVKPEESTPEEPLPVAAEVAVAEVVAPKVAAAEVVPPPPGPAPTPRSAPVASEPVLERVVVGPDATGKAPEDDDTPRPARRGWWQRR